MCLSDRELLADVASKFQLKIFARPGMDRLIDESVRESGRQNKRACLLRPRLVVWLVLAMSLYRELSIVNVFEQLVSLARATHTRLFRGMVSEEAVYRARYRLGVTPFKLLFRRLRPTKEEIEPTFHGYRVFGIDGSELTMPDTVKNEECFGRRRSVRGVSVFPQLRGVFLTELAARRTYDCSYLPCTSAERVAVPYLLKSLGEGDLLLMDRGLVSFRHMLLCKLQKTRFLFRYSKVLKPLRLIQFGCGDHLIAVKPCGVTRRQLASQFRDEVLTLRLIEFRVGHKGELIRLVTDLTDPVKYPALELAQLYHQRWECELAFREMKCDLATPPGNKSQTHLRSKRPVGVLQEAWSLLIVHLLLRDLMKEASDKVGVKPTEISFVNSLESIKLAIVVSPRKNNRRLLVNDLSRCRLRRSRRKQQYPRVVKRNTTAYKLKRPSDKPTHLDTEIYFQGRAA